MDIDEEMFGRFPDCSVCGASDAKSHDPACCWAPGFGVQPRYTPMEKEVDEEAFFLAWANGTANSPRWAGYLPSRDERW